MELLKYINEGEFNSYEIPFTAEKFATLVQMAEEEVVNRNNAKSILKLMIKEKKAPQDIAKEKGFLMNNNTRMISEVVIQVVDEFKAEVQGYFAGKEKLFGFLMGQCTKKLAGKANPKTIKKILQDTLNEIKQ